MKKYIALCLSVCALLTLAACGGGEQPSQPVVSPLPESAPPSEPAQAKYYTQTVTLNVFGSDVDVAFVEDAAGERYSFSYNFAGNDIEASGQIVDGVYTMTEDPSGFAVEIEQEVYAALGSSWEGDNGEMFTRAPFAAPEQKTSAGSKFQVVQVEMFGDVIEVTMTVNEDESAFTMEYEAMGEPIAAYGEIADGVYTVTDDPSGFGVKMIENVVPLLSDQWITAGGDADDAGAFDKHQEIVLTIFGSEVTVLLEADEAETQFHYSYEFAGNHVEAFGTMDGGTLTITEDPSGYASSVLGDVQSAMTGNWLPY